MCRWGSEKDRHQIPKGFPHPQSGEQVVENMCSQLAAGIFPPLAQAQWEGDYRMFT